MNPTKITLEIVNHTIRLRVDAKATAKGYTIIESTPISGASPKPETVALFRKQAAKYAKRFAIPFADMVA